MPSSPAFRSKQWAAASGATDLDPGEPSGAASGDVIHGIWAVQTGHSGFALPTGWAAKGASLSTADFTAYFGWIRRAGSAPSYDATWTGAVYAEAVIGAYSGCVATGDPYDTFQEHTEAASVNGPTAPPATSTSAATTFCMFGVQFAGSSGAWTTSDGSTIRSGASGDDVGFSDIAEASATTFTPAVFGGFGVFNGTRYSATAVLRSVGASTVDVDAGTDTPAVTDSLATEANYVRPVSDTATVTDSLAASATFERSGSDTAAVSDALSVGREIFVTAPRTRVVSVFLD